MRLTEKEFEDLLNSVRKTPVKSKIVDPKKITPGIEQLNKDRVVFDTFYY